MSAEKDDGLTSSSAIFAARMESRSSRSPAPLSLKAARISTREGGGRGREGRAEFEVDEGAAAGRSWNAGDMGDTILGAKRMVGEAIMFVLELEVRKNKRDEGVGRQRGELHRVVLGGSVYIWQDLVYSCAFYLQGAMCSSL
jgi:hypothetical protein